ncbi:hypothetical protein EKO27_g6549 [Xylaria grammica]|uniref:MAGE domain-containing protein n=1 Tax=Xylaria grammica TaxID=363999 RepID=A0A439D262_9PEZI|nr:hypothetical protein EKO27_g6549 [Xylaria grammica]
MPPQRRRRTGHHEDADENTQRRQTRRAPESDDGSGASENEDEQDIDMDRPAGADNMSEDQLVKKLVRRVFDAAQEQLQKVFGMEMAELPTRERRTLKDKQKAVKRGASQASASSRQYILISCLPKEYRAQPVIGPSRIPSTADEAAYVAFYTITLPDASQRQPELPMDKTDNVLQKLIRQGYLDKIVERVEGDEDSITWCVGPRGRVEVSPQSIAQVVSEVWRDPPDDFDKKLEKSLGIRRTGQASNTNRDRAEEEEDE